MNILLLTQNRTLQEMIGVAIREINGVDLIVHTQTDEIRGGQYDVLMVDDTFSGVQEVLPLARHMDIQTTVILHHKNSRSTGMFNYQIAKPFLPEDIRSLIGRIQANPQPRVAVPEQNARIQADAGSPMTLNATSRSHPAPETDVLDANEIDTIRTLLESEGLEIVGEEEMFEPTPTAPPPRFADVPSGIRKESGEQMLYKVLKKCKPKKIRKLLKGATVRIEITFPKAP